jgi:hypothetical protein
MIRGRIIILFLLLTVFFLDAEGKTLQGEDSIPVSEAISGLSKFYNTRILFRPEWAEGKKILAGDHISLSDDLLKILDAAGLSYYDYKGIYIVLFKDSKSGSGKNSVYRGGSFGSNILYRFEGRILAEKDESPVIGATIFISQPDTATITDINGFFRFKLPAGSYNLTIKSVGFADQSGKIDLKENLTVNYNLPNEVHELNEVVISGRSQDYNVKDASMGSTVVTMKSLKLQPAFLGEVDVIRGLLMLPGVSSIGEATTGFNVRGGSADQNLIIMDNAPIYNSSHVFGLFSAFNQDVVEEVTLLRAGIPPRYGGRLSSILDVRTLNSQANRFTGTGGIGLFASRLTLKIPVIKNKLSVITGGRISYSDYLLKLVKDPTVKNSSAFFYDANIKVNYSFLKSSQLQYSFYSSFDKFGLPPDRLYDWGTNNHSLSYSQGLGRKVFLNMIGALAQYKYGLNNHSQTEQFDWEAGINQKTLKAEFLYIPVETHKIDFGVGGELNYFKPGNLVPGTQSSVNPVVIQDLKSREVFAYAGDEFDLFPFLRIMAGVRYSVFTQLGPGTVNSYEPGIPKQEETITGSKSYSNGETISTYSGWQPRVSLRFLANDMSSIKISYNRLYQYIHLISNTVSITPIDLWLPSSPYLLPQKGDQVALGYFRNFNSNSIETSAEIYYKWIDNIVDYKDGADLFLNPHIETELLQGKGMAYGLELYAKKNLGRVTGFVSYTYSRSLRQIQGATSTETINNGKYYPSSYDKPHDFKITANYQINRRWAISGNWVYNTGRPATYPASKYEYDKFVIAEYLDRNMQRIPDYHRLDISITLNGNLRKHKFWDGSWNFSIYNVYGRQNAYSVYFKPVPGSRTPQAYKYSILGTALPSISYNFRFL